MKHIAIRVVGNAIEPAEPIPADALCVVCDGLGYIAYFEGDVLPAASPGACEPAAQSLLDAAPDKPLPPSGLA